ncbi:MAG TPA: histidinol-phosphate transaminase [Fimbriimonas sp.]|nr:histidinol-phosphate transaminase [Fimbriimonas sp.]
MASLIRPNVLQMTPYLTGKPIEEVKRELGLDRVIKLASNENPIGPSPKAVEAVRKAAERMHIYPDGAAFELKEKISSKFGVPRNQILVGNGSDELIHLIGLLFLGKPTDEMIVGDPSFSRFDASAHLAPSKLVKVPLDSDFRHDLPAMARAITENTKLVFVANPNNPTGTIVYKNEVDAFVRDLPEHVTFVLDEAYYEFAVNEPRMPNSLDYLAQGKNIIGLRTLSKAYGLAGIRVGYGFAPAWVSDAIDRAREPFDVNSLAQAAAVAAFDDIEHLKQTVEHNTRGLATLTKAFEAVGARPIPSCANFVFADLGIEAKPVFEALLRHGVITRSGHALGDKNSLRVTVGTDEEMEIFAAALKEVLMTATV